MSNVSAELDRTSCLNYEYCDPMRIFLTVLSAFGFLANVYVVIVVSYERQLHKPIYVGITTLAVADFLFLFMQFLNNILREVYRMFWDELIYFKYVVDIIRITAFMTSIGHVVFLSAQQFLFVVYPLKSLVWLTCKRIVFASLLIWMFFCAIGIVYIYFVIIAHELSPEDAKIVNWILTCVLFLGPIITLFVLHYLKIKGLKSSLADNRSTTMKKMSRIVSMVILVYVVTTTPINIKDILELQYGVDIYNEQWYILFYHIATVLLYLNHTINPFIYFLSTPQFKRAVGKCFGCKRIRRDSRFMQSDSSHSTNVSSLRSNMSSVKADTFTSKL